MTSEDPDANPRSLNNQITNLGRSLPSGDFNFFISQVRIELRVLFITSSPEESNTILDGKAL